MSAIPQKQRVSVRKPFVLKLSRKSGSNRRPDDYKSTALPTELFRRKYICSSKYRHRVFASLFCKRTTRKSLKKPSSANLFSKCPERFPRLGKEPLFSEIFPLYSQLVEQMRQRFQLLFSKPSPLPAVGKVEHKLSCLFVVAHYKR